MIDITGYHGTKKSRCMKILETHEWIPSTGIRHWLGDGIYFFESKDDAINWTARFKDESAIIEAKIRVDEDKFFYLCNKSHLEVFQEVANLILSNIQKHKLIIDNENKIDGYVLNFIYDNLYQFHVVRGIFTFPLKKLAMYREEYGTDVSRIRKVQVQYSVRECACIVNVSEVNIV